MTAAEMKAEASSIYQRSLCTSLAITQIRHQAGKIDLLPGANTPRTKPQTNLALPETADMLAFVLPARIRDTGPL